MRLRRSECCSPAPCATSGAGPCCRRVRDAATRERARPRRRIPLALAVLCGLAIAESVGAEPAPAVALVVAIDVSQSVDEARFTLQMEGIAAALEDLEVVAALTERPAGSERRLSRLAHADSMTKTTPSPFLSVTCAATNHRA